MKNFLAIMCLSFTSFTLNAKVASTSEFGSYPLVVNITGMPSSQVGNIYAGYIQDCRLLKGALREKPMLVKTCKDPQQIEPCEMLDVLISDCNLPYKLETTTAQGYCELKDGNIDFEQCSAAVDTNIFAAMRASCAGSEKSVVEIIKIGDLKTAQVPKTKVVDGNKFIEVLQNIHYKCGR